MKKNLKELIIILLESKLRTYNEVTVKVWEQGLKDYNIDCVEKAVHRLVKRKIQFMDLADLIETTEYYEDIYKKDADRAKQQEGMKRNALPGRKFYCDYCKKEQNYTWTYERWECDVCGKAYKEAE